MSYANAASSSGPTGHPDPLPKPQEVKTTGKPHGNVETVAEDKFNQIKKKVNEAKPTDAQVEDFKKEVHEAEERGKNFLVELWNRVVSSVTRTADRVNNDAYVPLLGTLGIWRDIVSGQKTGWWLQHTGQLSQDWLRWMLCCLERIIRNTASRIQVIWEGVETTAFSLLSGVGWVH